MVIEHFGENPQNKLINEDRSDCRAENLRYVTNSENVNYSNENRKKKMKTSKLRPCTDPVIQFDKNNTKINEFKSLPEVTISYYEKY